METEFKVIIQSEYGAWAEYVVVRFNSLLPVPNRISDQIAAQMLINAITASVLIKAGHNSLKAIQHVSSPGKTGIVLLKSPV
jgi:NADPH:quinone reductase-like Zn-dependent oxidoreductase